LYGILVLWYNYGKIVIDKMKNIPDRIRTSVLFALRGAIIVIVVGATLSSLFPLLAARSAQVSASSVAVRQPAAQFQGDFPTVEVVSSSSEEIVLDVEIPPLVEEDVQREGSVYQHLYLPHSGTATEIGKPELPAFGRFIALPSGAEVQIEVVEDTVETRTGYLVYPAQEPVTEQGEEPEFVIDLTSYQRDELYPPEIVQLEGPQVIRGVEVILVRFYPVQYNAARGELKIHLSFRVRVSFVGGVEALVDERLRSPYFDSLLSNILLNYSHLGPPPLERSGVGSRSTNGCDFLIITHSDFLIQANLLADWKVRRGIDTEVRTTAQTGSSASAIRGYIQNAYDTWNPAPSFVLFLGDAEFVPTTYQTIHPSQPPYDDETLIGTDLYYATVDGSDWLPDISTGRISVDTASEAQNIINKLINYERNPTSSTGFYSNIALAAYFKDDYSPYTWEDSWWVHTSEEIGSYLENEGYGVQRIYYAEANVDPRYYRDGDPLPAHLLRENGFPWNGNTTQIVNGVNSGRLILSHRDHGMRDRWAIPELFVSDVEGLTNGNKLPVVFSINCETGWFDNETDYWRHGTDYFEVNFAEAGQRNNNGGAAGVVAPTRISYGGYNDALTKGCYDAIWPGFLSYVPSPGPFSTPQYRMGQVLDYGKLYLASVYGTVLSTQITFEVFHYFGDPTMEIWTELPEDLTVSHPPVELAGVTSFTVDVAQDGALVSLVKDGEILGTALSSGGSATVNFSSPLTSGLMHVTVTKHNYRPHEGTVPVGDTIYLMHVPLVIKAY
jgi:hypothetical protein